MRNMAVKIVNQEVFLLDTKHCTTHRLDSTFMDMLPKAGSNIRVKERKVIVRERGDGYGYPSWALDADQKPITFAVVGYSKGIQNFRDVKNYLVLQTTEGGVTRFKNVEMYYIFSGHYKIVRMEDKNV